VPTKFSLLLFLVTLLAGSLLAQPAKPATADRHKANGVECAGCHGTGKKEPATSDACLSCHQSFEEVAKRTAALTPNPHSNHFVSESDVECTSCHHGHKADENACARCHRGMTFERKTAAPGHGGKP
jgi:fumarate reductase flavoprotein subunit